MAISVTSCFVYRMNAAIHSSPMTCAPVCCACSGVIATESYASHRRHIVGGVAVQKHPETSGDDSRRIEFYEFAYGYPE